MLTATCAVASYLLALSAPCPPEAARAPGFGTAAIV